MTITKIIVSVFLQYIFINSFSQSKVLNGKYGNAGNGSAEFIFYGKDSFSYAYSTCTDGLFGKGTFTLKSKTLSLFFEKKDCAFKSSFSIKESIIDDTSKSSKKLIVFFLDNCGNIISDFVGNPTLIINGNSRWQVGLIQNNNGEYFQFFDLKVRDIKLSFFCMGYESKEINIKMDSSKKVSIILDYDRKDFVSIKDGEIWKFEVKKICNEFIMLRNKDSTLGFKKYPKKL